TGEVGAAGLTGGGAVSGGGGAAAGLPCAKAAGANGAVASSTRAVSALQTVTITRSGHFVGMRILRVI
ncbi:MAG: hypothetical protein WAK35_00730, partial [Xanthobacteraceae bacterium]